MKSTRLFLYSAGILLFVTGIAKVISSCGQGSILRSYDLVFGLQFRALFIVTASIEVFVATACFRKRATRFAVGLVAWLATSFVAYRIALSSLRWRKPCPCLGNLTDALHVSPQLADTALKVALAYLMLGSYASLLWFWSQDRGQRMEAKQVSVLSIESKDK